MRMTFGFILVLVVAGLAYVRLAPSDAARWHVPVQGVENKDFANGALRVIEGDGDVLARADAFMRSLARTKVLAGDLASGRLTYVTRSKLFGFPDYTTIEYADGLLKAYARLRFGASDMGVNRERLEGLVAALER